MAIEGGVAALEGRMADARTAYLQSLALWRELDLDFQFAVTGLDIVVAGALEPSERQRVADETRAIFERIGAKPILAQLDEALDATGASVPRPGVARPDGVESEAIRPG